MCGYEEEDTLLCARRRDASNRAFDFTARSALAGASHSKKKEGTRNMAQITMPQNPGALERWVAEADTRAIARSLDRSAPGTRIAAFRNQTGFTGDV